jgi:hypothetical protein
VGRISNVVALARQAHRAVCVQRAGVGEQEVHGTLTDDRDNFAAERLHSTVTNQRCRPIAAGGGFFSERPVYFGT